MTLMTFKAYAEWAGVSLPAISRQAKGRLSEAVVKDGKRKYIDQDRADEIRSNPPAHGLNKGPARERPEKTKPKPKPKPADQPGQSAPDPIDDDKENLIDVSGVERCDTLTEAQKLDREYQAALRKLKFEEEMGRLVDAGKVEEEWSRHILAAKTKILGIKSKCAPIVYDAVKDDHIRESLLSAIDSMCREALHDLSSGR